MRLLSLLRGNSHSSSFPPGIRASSGLSFSFRLSSHATGQARMLGPHVRSMTGQKAGGEAQGVWIFDFGTIGLLGHAGHSKPLKPLR